MKVALEPGCYVVAVSGGVDSAVLLDLLHAQYKSHDHRFVIAHFDHGIRSDSVLDRQFVESLAQRYEYDFHYAEGNLGEQASEAIARDARYAFLHSIREEVGAAAVITAHHQDDLIETATINLIRGTGRLGLSSLKNTETILRPLLSYTKRDIIAYAKERELQWREDPTNQDTNYLRNQVRHELLPKMTPDMRGTFIEILTKAEATNTRLNQEIANFLQSAKKDKDMSRQLFVALPHEVAKEIMAAWLRQHDASFDRRTLERLVRDAKVLAPGKRVDIDGRTRLTISPATLSVTLK